MAGNFHESLQREAPELPSDRSTGLVLSAAAFGAAFLLARHGAWRYAAAAAAAVLLLLSLLAPSWLRPVNVAWMRFAHLLSNVVTPVVMLVLFALVIVPAGLFMNLRRDPLRRSRTAGDTYWVTRGKDEASSMRNQF